MTERRRISREAFEAHFFPGSRRIAPGIWIDREGGVHYSVPELLALVDLEDTPENRAEVAALIERRLAEDHPLATVIRHDPADH